MLVNPERAVFELSEADRKVLKLLPEWKRYQLLCEAFEIFTTSAKEAKEFTRRYLLAISENEHKPQP